MTRFTRAVGVYITACLLIVVAIVIRGDGPHPRVTGIYPPNGDQFWPGGAAQITFSQAMDQSSVERGLQVSPGSQGQGAWYGNTLNLQPVGDWLEGTTYHVRLVGKVTDDQGRPLRTPLSFSFTVRHVHHVVYCRVRGIQQVCERVGRVLHPLTASSAPVLQYALAPDDSALAYTRRDASGLPHLFLVYVDGTNALQLTRGHDYADSNPKWTPGDTSEVVYDRRAVTRRGTSVHLGAAHLWSVGTDGSNNGSL